MGSTALKAGGSALAGALSSAVGGGSGQEIYGFGGDASPLSTLNKARLANTGVFEGLKERAEDPFNFGPATQVQTPGFYHGGTLPAPIGLTGRDTGFQPSQGFSFNAEAVDEKRDPPDRPNPRDRDGDDGGGRNGFENRTAASSTPAWMQQQQQSFGGGAGGGNQQDLMDSLSILTSVYKGKKDGAA